MVDAVTTTEAASRTSQGRTTLVSNTEDFLSLLTAQLRNQDPLSPMDSTEWTSQLTQLSGVEQQILTNDLLTSLLEGQQSGGLTAATSYIGKDATAAWTATRLEDGEARWSYELAETAASVELQVLDSSGKAVWSGSAPQRTEGTHDFVWNGRTTGGGQLSDGGVYTLKVVARNGAAEVDSQVLMRGRVTGVELYDGQPYLAIGASIVPLEAVIGVEEPAQAAAAQPDEDETVPLAA